MWGIVQWLRGWPCTGRPHDSPQALLGVTPKHPAQGLAAGASGHGLRAQQAPKSINPWTGREEEGVFHPKAVSSGTGAPEHC